MRRRKNMVFPNYTSLVDIQNHVIEGEDEFGEINWKGRKTGRGARLVGEDDW